MEQAQMDKKFLDEDFASTAAEYYGRTITAAELKVFPSSQPVGEYSVYSLRLIFEDGAKMYLWDSAGFCCERRFMTTDDDPKCLVGKKLTKIELKRHMTGDGRGDCNEVLFVEVAAEDEHITLVTHNEHNGYYGGFDLKISDVMKGEGRDAEI